MDLNPDGTLTLDFGDSKVTVHPPKVGAYRRLRKELYDVDVKRAAYVAGLDESVGQNAINNLSNEFQEGALLGWWSLILVGDSTFKALTTDAVPDSQDDWPLELALNGAAIRALAHWVGGAPLPSSTTPAPTPEADPASNAP